MKKLIALNLVIGLVLILSSFGALYAQTNPIPGDTTQPCSASNVNSDQCYVQDCTGVSSEDSASCNAYAGYVVKRDDGGDTSCQSIGDGSGGTVNNEKSCCLDANGNLSANASPMCRAFEDNTSAEVAKDSGASTLSLDNGGGTGNTQRYVPGSGASGGGLSIHLNNPLSGVSTIPDAINKFLGIVIRIALPIIIIFFIWSGFSFILARGNPKKVTDAKNMFFFTIIGTLLILGAWVITNAIIGTVNIITG